MKTNSILLIACIGIGIAIGWFAKPAATTPAPQTAQDDSPKTSTRKEPASTPPSVAESQRTITSTVEIIDTTKPDEMSEDQRARAEKHQNRFDKMLKESQQKKLEARISKLVAQLNLTPDQEAALRKAMEENQVDTASIMSGDFAPSQLAGLTGDGPMEEALADILTDEQKAEHKALKERELANKVESKALTNLAKLSGLDMTQEQKDAAYDILYKQAEESASKEASPGNSVFTAMTEGFGLEIDPEDLGLDFDAMGAEAYNNAKEGETPKPQDIMARMKEGQQRKIDEKVDALRPVLNEDQLQQYRQSLEIKQGSILGGFLGGFGAEEAEGE